MGDFRRPPQDPACPEKPFTSCTCSAGLGSGLHLIEDSSEVCHIPDDHFLGGGIAVVLDIM